MNTIEFLTIETVSWASAVIVLIGLGSLLLKLASKETSEIGLGERFWTGLVGVIAFVLVWNLFWPVSWIATTCTAALGALGLLVDRQGLLCRVRVLCLANRLELSFFALFALGIAWAAAGECVHYDTGLYGASAVKWAVSYPAVPGLANLHGRLAFNSSSFLCLALLDHGWWHDRSQHFFSPMLIAALGAWAVPAFVRVLRNPRGSKIEDLFSAMLLLPLIPYLPESIASMDSDIPVLTVALAAAAIVFRWAAAETKSSLRLMVVALLLAAMVTLKLSSLIFAVLMAGFVLAALKSTASGRSTSRTISVAGLMIATLAITWLIRGSILSGYLLYPNQILSAPVEWRATRAAIFDTQWITSWARTPGASPEQTQGTQWLGGWLKRTAGDRQQVVYPLLVLVMSMCGGVIAVWRGANILPRELRFRSAAMLVPAGAGLIFWFATAPDPRFAAFDIWVIVATIGTLALRGLSPRFPLASRALLILPLLVGFWSVKGHLRPSVLLKLRDTDPAAMMPQGLVAPFVTRSGLMVYVPVNTDQCWNAPLPCTPYPDADLRLRVPGDLSKGFVMRQQ